MLFRVASGVRFWSVQRASSPRFFSGYGRRLALTAGLLLPAVAAFGQTAASAVKVPTKIDLNVSTTQGAVRTQATFTARVAASGSSEGGSASAPTGSVSFMNGEQSIGAAFVDAEGRATYTADALPGGTQNITAVYVGDDSYQASSSTATAVNAATGGGVPTFSLSASTASLKVVAGNTATTVITATPENGFNQLISLSCSGAPYVSVTCIFSPTQVTPGAATKASPNGVPALSTLTIQTTAYTGAVRDGVGMGRGSETAYALVLPGIFALAGLGLARKRGVFGFSSRSARQAGLVLLLLAGGMGLGGCSQRYGYFHKAPTGNPGTAAGTYVVTISGITGTGSTLSTATVQVTLTVTTS